MTRGSAAKLAPLVVNLAFASVVYVDVASCAVEWGWPLGGADLIVPSGVFGPLERDFWSGDLSGGYFRPVGMLSLSLQHSLGGASPGASHVVNALLHVGMVAALLSLFKHLLRARAGAMAASLTFALLPLFVEAVAWTPGRFEIASALCVVGAIALHIRGGVMGRIGGAALFGLGLLCHESSVIAPALALAYDLIYRGRPARSWTLTYATLMTPLLVYFAWRAALGLALPIPSPSFLPSYATAVWSYLHRIILPVSLDTLTVYSPVSRAVAALIALFVVAVSVLLLTRANRQQEPTSRALAWGWIWFIAALCPLAIAGPNLEVLSDRYAYLPAVGLALMAAAGVESAIIQLRRAVASRVILAFPVVGLGLYWATLGWVTAQRVQDWRSEASVIAASLRVNPDNAITHRMQRSQLDKSNAGP